MKRPRTQTETQPIGPGRWTLRLYQIYERTGPRARRYEVRTPQKEFVALCRIKKGADTISVYGDEKEQTEILRFRAKPIRQYAAAYDVLDGATGKLIGEFRKKVYRPLKKTEWFIFNADGDPLGMVTESSANSGLLGRFMPMPAARTKSFDVHWGQTIVGRIQRKGLIGMEHTLLDLSLDKRDEMDRRLAIGVAVLVRDHERSGDNGQSKERAVKPSADSGPGA
jgi:hypothetical protein